MWSEKYGSGVDGSLTISADTTDSTANTSCSGVLGSTTLNVGSSTGFADGSLLLIYQTRNGGDGAGVWELNKIASGGTTTSWTLSYALTHNYDTTAQVYLLKQYSSVTIDNTKTLTGQAWLGTSGGILAFLCNGTITVTGTITGVGKGYRGGSASSASAGNKTGNQGEGNLGARDSRSSSANGNAGGGGVGSDSSPYSGGGAGGGHSASGSNGSNGAGAGGTGGGTSGVASLVTATYGGGGAEGGVSANTQGFGGGNSGGFILLIAPVITVTGSIKSDGNNGTDSIVFQGSGAGGGAGGGPILLKCVIGTLGTNLITAVKGTGGVAGSGAAGGNGVDGRIHIDYASSFTGTTNPTIDSTLDSTENSSTSTSTSITTSTTTSTSTTVSMTTSTSTTSTSSSTSTTTTSTSTTTTSTSTTSTSTTSTSSTRTLPFHLEIDTGR